MNANSIIINDKEYVFIKKINLESNCYCYFTNVSDESDLCIRKLVFDNNELLLVGLDNEEELLQALEYFNKK